MGTITNNSKAPKVVNIKGEKSGDKPKRVFIAPGASVEGDPVETDVWKANVAKKHLSHDKGKANKAPEPPAPPPPPAS